MALALPHFSLVLLLFIFLCSCYSNVHGDDEGFEAAESSTLKPGNVCAEWTAPSSNSLRLVHRHGPCSPFSDGRLDDMQILIQDLAQDLLSIAYFQSEIRRANAKGNMSTMGPLQQSLQITLPARHGEYIGNHNYVLTIAIGTPKKSQTLMVDTGSNICWVQCMPCRTCYRQAEPFYDLRSSSTYRGITCNASACTNLPSVGAQMGCMSNTCTYYMRYGDGSRSFGFLATERLELSAPRASPIVLPDFIFGCGTSNVGEYYNGAAGILGLGRRSYSLMSQESSSLGSVFSYCLPSTNNVPGYLTIGHGAAPAPSYIRMINGNHNDLGFYYVDLVGISVDRQRLQLSPTIFHNVGTILDSGSVITHLPRAAYTALRDAFRQGMSRYRQVRQLEIMDTCYSVPGANVSHPSITLHFSGHDLPLGTRQTLLFANATTCCLAFAASSSEEVSVIGNTQQKGMEVIYDIGAQRIGFSRGTDCH